MAANERIGVAQAMCFPSFNIAALAGFANNELSSLFDSSSCLQNAIASVAGSIFNFGKLSTELRFIIRWLKNLSSFTKKHVLFLWLK
jgi:outer membrane protein TolC